MKVFFLICARDSTEILLCELSVHRQEKTVCHAGKANPYGDNYGLRLNYTWTVSADELHMDSFLLMNYTWIVFADECSF